MEAGWQGGQPAPMRPFRAAGGVMHDSRLLKLTKRTQLYSVKYIFTHNPLVLCTVFYLRDHSNEITSGSNDLKIRLVIVEVFLKTSKEKHTNQYELKVWVVHKPDVLYKENNTSRYDFHFCTG